MILTKKTFHKWITLLGVFLILSPLGLTFYWGNLYVYVTSFYVDRLHNSGAGVQAPWVVTIKLCFQSLSSVTAGVLKKKVGDRVAVLIGIILTLSSYFLAFLAMQSSNKMLFNLAFGIPFGLGDGLIILTAIEYVLEWVDKNSGFYIAVCRTGIYLGAIVANLFVSSYINPNNLLPEKNIGSATFFTQKEILESVPYAFLYTGIIFTVFQITGFVLLKKNEDSSLSTDSKSVSYKSLRSGSEKVVNPDVEEASPSSPSSASSASFPSPNHSTLGEDNGMTTKQMLKTSQFYALFVTFLMSNISVLIITNYYKSFGQIWIHDDHFLSGIGSAIPIVTAFISVVWGTFSDRLGVKLGLILFSSSLTVLSAFYYLTPMVHMWVFCVTTLILLGIVTSKFTIYNISTVKVFGRKHQLTNYGVMNLASLGLLFTPPIIEAVLVHLGWFYLFSLSAVLNLVTSVWFILSLKRD